MAVHRFLPNSEENATRTMLEKLRLTDVDDLFEDIPKEIRLNRPLDLPEGMSEIELEKLVNSKLARNKAPPEFVNFIGGGVWVSHVPSVVSEILSRGEFYTAYTPYQPEISQGMLQSMFEYQSQICELTGMDVANSSMYDWGSALGEAGRMTVRVTGRNKILVAENASPERVAILRTYSYPASIEVRSLKYLHDSGSLDIDCLKEEIDDQTAAVYLENPNFFGIIEDKVAELSEIVHRNKALLIVGVNPATLGILKPPSEYGADIVVGDGQPLGLYSNFGGPLMGIFATRNEPGLLRQIPGRLIGMTVSKKDNRRGYSMVLQTREQHIRREQATSNICTNEALLALAVNVYLSTMGPSGMEELGKHLVSKAHFLVKRLNEEGLASPYFTGSFFGDFTFSSQTNAEELANRLLPFRILGGLPLGRFYDELDKVSVFSVSDLHSTSDLEALVNALKELEKKS